MKKTIKLILSGFIFIILLLNTTFSQVKADENPEQETKNLKLNTEIFQTAASQKNYKSNRTEELFSKNNLKQYGYDIFNNKIPLSSGHTSENYKIKEGDTLNIYFWGDSIDLLNISTRGFLTPTNNVSVDNQGNIFIQGIGIVSAKNKTTFETEKIITRILSQKIDNFEVKVNIANSENFPVIITGNIKNPGTFYINNDFSMIDILSMAGGINKNGSLRNIIHISGYKKSEIDLYDLLIKGKTCNKEFKKGDVILIKPLGDVIAINSGVKRPAIYEFKQGESLKDLIFYAGGFLPSISKDIINIDTFEGQNFKKKTIKVDFSKIASIYPHNGDMVEFKTLFNSTGNIEVSGCILNSGLIPYKENMTLKNVLNLVKFEKDENIQYINNSDKDDVDINNIIAEISTINDEGIFQTKTVYLYELLTKNQEDVVLKSEDKILFRALKENENLKTIEVLGYVKKPGIIKLYSDMKLLDAIKIAGGTAKEGYLEGLILLRPSISEEQKKILEKAALDLNKGILEAANKSQIVPNEDKNFLTTQKELIKIMEKKADKEYGRISLNIKTCNPENFSDHDNITLQDGDKIYVPIKPQHIMIIGEVLNPSAIVFSPDKTFNNYIDAVGGLTKEADKKKIYISKANGFSQRLAKNDKICIKAGDSIIVPRKISKPIDWFEFSKNFAAIIANTLNTIFIITKI